MITKLIKHSENEMKWEFSGKIYIKYFEFEIKDFSVFESKDKFALVLKNRKRCNALVVSQIGEIIEEICHPEDVGYFFYVYYIEGMMCFVGTSSDSYLDLAVAVDKEGRMLKWFCLRG